MILLIMACVGVGFCGGGLVNEMYRRRHPYVRPLPVRVQVLKGMRWVKSESYVNVNVPKVKPSDPSPNRRLSDYEWRQVAEGDSQK